MRNSLLALLLLTTGRAYTQELFVYTEPASNMSAKSLGARLTQNFAGEQGRLNYMVKPELMLGLSKKLMFHADAIFSNDRHNSFGINGAGLYAKYRFYSSDEVHRHFRMAAFGSYSFANNHIPDAYIQLQNRSSGYEAGLIATRLKDKLALSAGASVVHALDNRRQPFKYGDAQRNALNYSLSSGLLVLPKEYTSYKQTNLNVMLEVLGQVNLGNGQSIIDLAPSVQLIFNSRMRLDLGYRQPLLKSGYRNMLPGGLVRFEYNFFNVFK
jgi:hypothetical protein